MNLEEILNKYNITKQELSDRFFLEELVRHLDNGEIGALKEKIADWMSEKIEHIPLTDKERDKIIEEWYCEEVAEDYLYTNENELKERTEQNYF